MQFFLHFFTIFSMIFSGLGPLGMVTLVRKPDFQAVIKSAASAASPPAWGAPDDGARWDDGARPDDGTGFGRRLGALPKPSGRLR